ncbi:hypothetical protein JOM56_001838 [Amanita muscaria]
MALDLRRSTVYDFSDLRLHRDGTRIQQTDKNYEASSRRKFSVRDAHGKWRAKDAAGLGTVARMRCANLGSDTAKEHGFSEQGETRQLHTKRGRIRLEEKRRGVQPLEHRTVKRWRFEESLDFLDGTPNEVPATSIEDRENLPVPSSELLKNIHYIAAEFYTERGQLLNLGKKYRAEKKRRRKGKNPAPPRKKRRVDEVTDADADRRKTPDPDSDEYRESSSSDPEFGSDSSDSSSPSEADGDNESSVPAEEVEGTPSSKSTKERKKRYTRSLREIRQKHQQDMYRVMNGSALMVLGMLVQEHVAKLVRGKVPEGWEEGSPPEDEERSEEGEEQVESESEGGEDAGENDDEDEDEDVESGMEDDDGDDSGGIDEVADDNRRRRW